MGLVIRTPKIPIPLQELDFSYVRSSGPGGQNVNKVNSKAVLRWNLMESTYYSPLLFERIRTRLAARLTKDGDLILMSDRFRDQKQNKDDCIQKLTALLESAVTVPKTRKDTKPTHSSKRRKREAKGQKSEVKKLRGKVRV